MTSADYSEQEWTASAGHHPLKDRTAEDLLLLHRHWMWANQQREAFDGHLQAASDDLPKMGPAMLASKQLGFMFVWYSMLWAVIEACIDVKEGRKIDIRGKFRADIDRLSPVLRRCRNAILHVPRAGKYFDERMVSLVSEEDSAVTLRRISRGFGRLFLEESARRDNQLRLEPRRRLRHLPAQTQGNTHATRLCLTELNYFHPLRCKKSNGVFRLVDGTSKT